MTRLRQAAAVLGCIAVVVTLWLGWRVQRDHGTVPLAEGTAWRFKVSGSTGETISLHLDGSAPFKGTDALLVSCERERAGSGTTELGRGYVVDRWLGLDLIGAQGPFGERAVNLRVLPYPLPFGVDWTSSLGEGWTDRWKAVCRGAVDPESVTVPAGSFETVRVSTDIQFASQSPIASVDYWIARGVGPVKVKVDLHDGRPTLLELVEKKP